MAVTEKADKRSAQHLEDVPAESPPATVVESRNAEKTGDDMPYVDFAKAAQLRPSRVTGKKLYAVVMVIAGVG